MRTAAQRIAHYDARMLSTLIDPTLTAINAQAVANYTAYAIEFVTKQVAMRAVLDGDGIPTWSTFLYEAFNGELYAVWKKFAGTTLTGEAQIIKDKYATLGAAGPTLISIALNVYGITVT